MGPCLSRSDSGADSAAAAPPKTYSWDTRKAIDPRDVSFKGLDG